MKDSSALTPRRLTLQQLCPRKPGFCAFALATGWEVWGLIPVLLGVERLLAWSHLSLSVSITVWLSWDALSPAEIHVKFSLKP